MPLHVSSTIVLIVRRSKLYYTTSGITTHCRWQSGAQVERVLCTGRCTVLSQPVGIIPGVEEEEVCKYVCCMLPTVDNEKSLLSKE